MQLYRKNLINCIYLVDARNFKPPADIQTAATFFLIGEVTEDLKNHPSYDLICFRSSFSISMIYQRIQEVFLLYDNWQKDLLSFIINNKSLSEICKLSIPIFKNPMMILGPNHEFLGIGEDHENYKITYDYREKDTDFLSADLVMELSSDPLYYQTFQSTLPRFYVDAQEMTCIYENIFIQKQYSARIVIDSICRDVNECDLADLHILSGYVKKYLELNQNSSFNFLKLFKTELSYYIQNQQIPEHSILEESLKRIHWNMHDHYMCAIFSPGHHTVLSKGIMHQCNLLETHFHGCIALQNEGMIIAIFNQDRAIIPQEEFHQKFSYFVREQVIKTGVSNAFCDFYQLPDFYMQAKSALELGETLHPSHWIYHFSDYRLEYVLRHGIHQLPVRILLPEPLKEMIKYDAKHQSQYSHTLKIYLQNNMSAVKVTEILYIHRSTFKYRMVRIQEFLGNENLENPQLRLYYLIMFQLIDTQNFDAVLALSQTL